MRQCPFTGCGRKIDPSKFACATHWYRLNKDQQARIYACYRKWQSGKIGARELRDEQELVIREVESPAHGVPF